MKNPKLIAGSACISSASGQFGPKPGKSSRLHTLLALALVFAGATSHAISLPSIPPASHNHPRLLGDGLVSYQYDSEGRMESATTGQGADAPQTKYAHNGLGQRVFKTEPLYSSAAAKPASTKTLANLLADDDEGGQTEQPGFIEQFKAFLSKLWSPATSDAEKLGWSYVYGEDGTLLGEYGSGGANSAGTAQYLYLPTASGPMPIAAVIKGQTYAIHSDHLNTPRKLTQADGQAAWQWEYSAFGDEQPTTAAKRFTSETTTPTTGATSVPEVTFNLRYPGQYFDAETKLHYNYFRSYDSRTGRYTQGDPIGLDGGFNRFGYVGGNPLSFVDPNGLEKIILFNPNSIGNHQKALNLMAIAFLDKSNELLIFGHSNSEAIADDRDGGMFWTNRRVLGANELVELIIQSGKWKVGMPITLYGCESGQGKDSIAKKISGILKTRVTGFPDKITYDPVNARARPHRPIIFEGN
ncbi:RHS repeat domain-containing protein [Acidovorax sp. sic0104]|uniref:RHS repeat domain-containing protein n=2 Tax=Acidovorax sp. sic0104 TaxID=2854784 RepID=UPI001C4974E8|nr:RHS repeat-associated core domain-containing protein [Acidovorax sp. sic0104]MBV7541896.1 hypothetical protein [Acidovorax sp. sic0104]